MSAGLKAEHLLKSRSDRGAVGGEPPGLSERPMMKILITGGSGKLGSELRKLNADIIAPTRAELDITDEAATREVFERYNPNLIIHAAAQIENLLVEADPTEAIQVNIKGTANVALACLKARRRLVYISTDYVYSGERGNYRETDEILPTNPYAWTKLGGEASARLVPNHLIIRTSFGPAKFAYPVAFQDKWTSKDYVDRLAVMVLEAATSPLIGILNLGTERKTLYSYARERNPDVKPIRVGESAFATPYDTSLNLERWIQYKGDKPVARTLERCRACNCAELEVYLDLGLMPLANNLAHTPREARGSQRFPLQILLCKKCLLSQLSVVVDSDVLFGYYTYRSSVNPSFVQHCGAMADSLGEALQLSSGELVVDIAGNDGTLLRQFRERLGVRTVNVEPAGNIAAVSAAQGIATLNEFWSPVVAERLVAEHGRPKLITATNVFAHVDDIWTFLKGAKSCLDAEGTLVLEFPYLVDLISQNEFDTVYFEHLSYVPITPMVSLAKRAGLQLWKVEKHAIHGGSVRVFLAAGERAVEASVQAFCDEEARLGFHDLATYQAWAAGVYALVENLSKNLIQLKRTGAKIAAFGASAKGNTLLNACRITTSMISYIVDDTPEKIGKFQPGTGIPIVNRSELYKNRPDYLLVLAWNFLDDVMASTREFQAAGGKYILPIPEFQIL